MQKPSKVREQTEAQQSREKTTAREKRMKRQTAQDAAKHILDDGEKEELTDYEKEINKRFSHLKKISYACQMWPETQSSLVSSPVPGQLLENGPFVTLITTQYFGCFQMPSCRKSLCDDTFIGLVYGQWIVNSENFRRWQLYFCLSDVCLSENSDYTYLHHLLLSE